MNVYKFTHVTVKKTNKIIHSGLTTNGMGRT